MLELAGVVHSTFTVRPRADAMELDSKESPHSRAGVKRKRDASVDNTYELEHAERSPMQAEDKLCSPSPTPHLHPTTSLAAASTSSTSADSVCIATSTKGSAVTPLAAPQLEHYAAYMPAPVGAIPSPATLSSLPTDIWMWSACMAYSVMSRTAGELEQNYVLPLQATASRLEATISTLKAENDKLRSEKQALEDQQKRNQELNEKIDKLTAHNKALELTAQNAQRTLLQERSAFESIQKQQEEYQSTATKHLKVQLASSAAQLLQVQMQLNNEQANSRHRESQLTQKLQAQTLFTKQAQDNLASVNHRNQEVHRNYQQQLTQLQAQLKAAEHRAHAEVKECAKRTSPLRGLAELQNDTLESSKEN